MTDQILNYMWISRKNQDSGTEKNPIPEAWCANVIDVAERNPDTQIIVWVSDHLLTPESQHLVRQRFAEAGLGNIEIRDLNEIPAYRDDDFFQNPKPTEEEDFQIRWRADLTRFIVLLHVLENFSSESVFYSDFNVVDPPLKKTDLAIIFDRHGLVLSRSGNEDAADLEYGLENNFMGFRRRQVDFLKDKLVIQTGQTAQSIPSDEQDACFEIFEKAAQVRAQELGEQDAIDLTVPVTKLEDPEP